MSAFDDPTTEDGQAYWQERHDYEQRLEQVLSAPQIRADLEVLYRDLDANDATAVYAYRLSRILRDWDTEAS